jgi:hypothetical protein
MNYQRITQMLGQYKKSKALKPILLFLTSNFFKNHF